MCYMEVEGKPRDNNFQNSCQLKTIISLALGN